MNKPEFLAELRKSLSDLPQDNIEERPTFYSEMLDDRIEEGLSEEETVLAVGAVDEIVRHAVADIPPAKIAKERITLKRRLKAGEIVLLALSSLALSWDCRGRRNFCALRFGIDCNRLTMVDFRRICRLHHR